ncbi:MAG TPA: hypothetical protein VNX70_15680 [Bryobacteraceae bacterium]|nr:hypothetical protein [Bryobacteraceae bacterium]
MRSIHFPPAKAAGRYGLKKIVSAPKQRHAGHTRFDIPFAIVAVHCELFPLKIVFRALPIVLAAVAKMRLG